MELNTGDFIYHLHYGVGRIQDFEASNQTSPSSGDLEFNVKFQNGEIKPFTQELLDRGARKISPSGFRAYTYLNEAGAQELLVSNPVEAITMVLQDFPGLIAKNEDFKDYLSPYIPNWTEWWETVQPKLKESPQIDTSRSKFREYGLRKDAMSPAEEIYRSFQRIRFFENKSFVYDQARRTLTEYRNGSHLPDKHLQDVLNYVEQLVETDSNPPAMRLDAAFRLQEGKWASVEKTTQHISKIIKSGFRLYDLDLFSLNRTVAYLLSVTLTQDEESLLSSAICSGEPAIKAICEWALQRGESRFIALLLVTALSENIPPRLENENLATLAVRLKYLGTLVKSIEIENEAWPLAISHFQDLISAISQLDGKVVPPLFLPLIEFSQTLYERLNSRRPELVAKIFDSLFNRNISKPFILGLLDSARKSKQFSEFGNLLEQHLWSDGEGRNFDFIKELTQSKGTIVEQVKSLLEVAGQYNSHSLKGHIGATVCDLVKKDEVTDPILFLPYLNQLYEWGSQWDWSDTVAGLRESAYLDALERSRQDFGDNALRSAVYRFLRLKTQELDSVVERLNADAGQASQRIKELEGLLAEKEQVVRELRGGYGGDTAEASFSERVRIVKELASSVAEFERMVLKTTEQSRDLQAIILRLNSIMAGLKVTPMEAIGAQVQFSPQKHQVVGAAIVDSGELVVIVERGYLIRDNNEKLRLLKPALVKKTE